MNDKRRRRVICLGVLMIIMSLIVSLFVFGDSIRPDCPSVMTYYGRLNSVRQYLDGGTTAFLITLQTDHGVLPFKIRSDMLDAGSLQLLMEWEPAFTYLVAISIHTNDLRLVGPCLLNGSAEVVKK